MSFLLCRGPFLVDSPLALIKPERHIENSIQRSAMASSSAEKLPKLSISQTQFHYCTDALRSLKDKLQSPEKIHQEFDHLQRKTVTQSYIVALYDSNSTKNRYPDVLPFDQSRVVLNSSPGKDYINASFLNMGSSEKSLLRLIATQGPLPNTFEDFWDMVIQYKSPVIVMLTRLRDNNHDKVRCGDYFQVQSEVGSREIGEKISISIVSKTTTTDTSLILSCLEVKNKESEVKPMSVLHIQYLEWPDHGVPKNTIAVREILKRINHGFENNDMDAPVIVHCSAGIGRTGALCLILNTIQRIIVGDMSALDLVNTLDAFKSRRSGMVETIDQLMFCYDAIVDELEELVSDFNLH